MGWNWRRRIRSPWRCRPAASATIRTRTSCIWTSDACAAGRTRFGALTGAALEFLHHLAHETEARPAVACQRRAVDGVDQSARRIERALHARHDEDQRAAIQRELTIRKKLGQPGL